MHRVIAAGMIGACFVLGSCASNSYCLGEQDYYKAESVPPVQPIEGLKVPQSSSALTIPPPPASTVPFGQTIKDKDGEEKIACLDQPPPMAEPVEKPAETDKSLPPPPNPTKPGEPVGPPPSEKPKADGKPKSP